MPSHLIEVAFKGNRKEFFLWEGEAPPPAKAGVIVEADRGEDLGHVHATGELAQRRSTGTAHGIADGAASKRALRLATEEDLLRTVELRGQNEVARRRAMERVKANNLVMKLTDAEWQWDRKKLTFYFTAEKRVDFRALVRDLAAMFRTRIELKQIGVRDEARRLDGIGRCGRQYCSASWLPELRPVNLGVAKDQKLSLNPTQISGACGRLMCCLRYEHDFYVQSRKRFPKEGKILATSKGEEKVVANDIFNDRVTLRTVEGEMRVVPLLELRQEMAAIGTELPDPGAAAEPLGSEDMGEELHDGGTAVAAPPRPPRRAPTSRPDPLRSLPVVPAPGPAPVREAARRLERVSPDAAAADTADGVADEADDAEDATDATDAPDTPAGAEGTGEEGDRRPRRRRGRRGGRRGRGGGTGGGTSTTSSDSPDTPS